MLEDFPTNVEALATMVLATGALGTAAFGVVDGFKWTSLGEAGFTTLKRILGTELLKTLANAYGDNYEELLKAQYREDRSKGEIGRTLRQGIRIGLPAANISSLAAELPGVNSIALSTAASAIQAGNTPTDPERQALARFELAVDTRIDAALSLAQSHYKGWARAWATIFSLIFAFIAWVVFLGIDTNGNIALRTIGLSFLVGCRGRANRTRCEGHRQSLSPTVEKAIKVRR